MSVDSKVVAAIGAALQLYMQAGEQPAVQAEPERRLQMPGPVYSPWAMAGRQSMMETRRMWQMRLLR